MSPTQPCKPLERTRLKTGWRRMTKGSYPWLILRLHWPCTVDMRFDYAAQAVAEVCDRLVKL
jgi:hypothetical protein